MNKYTPVIADLGMAQTPEIAKNERFWGGTAPYMGTKVYKNIASFGYYKCTGDIFSMGVIALNVILGRMGNEFYN